jgi:hypothetical protein
MNDGLPRGITGEYPDRCPYSRGHEPYTLAAVVGSGPCRDDDLEKLEELRKPSGIGIDIIAVNRAGVVLPRVDHWISIHGEFLAKGLDRRIAFGRDLPRVVVGNFLNGNHDQRLVRWEVCPYPGSSSMYAVRWALYWGYRRIALCGVPLTGHQSMALDGETIRSNAGYTVYRDGWEAMMKKLPLTECVRSFSGWTRKQFGAPESKFLEA